MSEFGAKYRLNLLGSFGLYDPQGVRVEIPSRKSVALLGLLATSRDGARSRTFLQDMLWGSRSPAQAQASLRRELSNLRHCVNGGSQELIVTQHSRVSLRLDALDIDILSLSKLAAGLPKDAVFLEGVDLQAEDGFEDWLREQRAQYREALAAAKASLQNPSAETVSSDDGFFGRPFLAVLPFANLTENPANAYLAEGLAEELIEHLSRLRWLPIISRAASFAYSTTTTSLAEIGEILGARYVVEGRLRAQAEGLSLTTSISESFTGQAIWTWRTDLPPELESSDLERVLTAIVGALASSVDDAEMTRAVARPESSPRVTNLIWRARWHHNRYTIEDSLVAEQLLSQALALAPNSPEAILQLAYFRQRQLWLTRADRAEVIELRRLAQRAISADYLDGRGYMIAGIAELWLKHTSTAIGLLKQAISLNPSLAYAYSQLGAAYYLSGDPEQATGMLLEAMRLNMGEEYAYYLLGELAMCHAMLGRWDDAISFAEKSLLRRPGYWYAHISRVWSLMRRGQREAALGALAALRESNPGFKLRHLDWVPFVDQTWPDQLKKTLSELDETLVAPPSGHDDLSLVQTPGGEALK